MRDDIRKAILNGERKPDGLCVTCGQPTCEDNRFLCQEHHIAELTAFFRRLSRDVLGLVINTPKFDKFGYYYGIYPPTGDSAEESENDKSTF